MYKDVRELLKDFDRTRAHLAPHMFCTQVVAKGERGRFLLDAREKTHFLHGRSMCGSMTSALRKTEEGTLLYFNHPTLDDIDLFHNQYLCVEHAFSYDKKVKQFLLEKKNNTVPEHEKEKKQGVADEKVNEQVVVEDEKEKEPAVEDEKEEEAQLGDALEVILFDEVQAEIQSMPPTTVAGRKSKRVISNRSGNKAKSATVAAKVTKALKLKPAPKKLADAKGSCRLVGGKKASMPVRKTVTRKKNVLTPNVSNISVPSSSSASSSSSTSVSSSDSEDDSSSDTVPPPPCQSESSDDPLYDSRPIKKRKLNVRSAKQVRNKVSILICCCILDINPYITNNICYITNNICYITNNICYITNIICYITKSSQHITLTINLPVFITIAATHSIFLFKS